MPTVAEVGPISKTLGNILTGAPVTYGALTVIPLLGPLVSEPEWLTLGEAPGQVRITEVNEAGSVPTLTVENLGDRPILLLDGEELLGAKQNRILNTTVLIAAHTTVEIPVSCVEQGRWGYRGRQFAASDVSLFASLRQKKSTWVGESLRQARGHVADQGGVWEGLAARAAERGVQSPTGAMHDFYLRYENDIGAARKAFAPAPGQLGALVYISGRWVGLDLLAGAALFSRAWPRLVAGYAADAIGRKLSRRRTPSSSAVLQAVLESPAEPAPAVALGTEYRLAGQLTGAALVIEDRVAHLMAFPGGMPGPGA